MQIVLHYHKIVRITCGTDDKFISGGLHDCMDRYQLRAELLHSSVRAAHAAPSQRSVFSAQRASAAAANGMGSPI